VVLKIEIHQNLRSPVLLCYE